MAGSESDIAVVGMACRLPGARNADEFWKNVRGGVESIRRYSDEELLAAGVRPALLSHPRYVKAGAPLDDMDLFDAEFFGFSPKDAAIMDPQHRQLLEVAWEALEDAGHPPERFQGTVGVYAGCGMNAYMMFNLLTNPDLMESVGLFLVRHTGNDKDFLATRISYCLNLTGPSVNVQTACSTSLVAIHVASQNLLSGECDLALAGGVTIEIPHRQGYLYEEGEILSPDGHCRSFDASSQGTVFGSGAGMVVLRRLEDALADGDHVYAVIKGSAINNDGSSKVGYLAPSVDGQAKAVAEALAVAGVEPDSIGYIECHGTGTPVGDPIEIAALTEAYRAGTDKTGFCAIGSVKSNIGHLDTAAGVASFIKAAQALRHRELPPSLHFESPNPNIDFASSPFRVNAALAEWRSSGPRRAGVSSLGVGGTNAHVILEEAAPAPKTAPSARRTQLLTLSARNPAALEAASERLVTWLRAHPDASLADVAYTLHLGRREFDSRRSLAASSVAEAIESLAGRDPAKVSTRRVQSERPTVAFLFPGGGAQYPRMGADLYASEPVFREHVERGLKLAQERHGLDLRPLFFPSDSDLARAELEFHRPSLQLPAIFIVEVALAELWKSLGVVPSALAGHSMGENTAACVAGVMRYEDALGLVALRGKLFERVPAGGMLSVPLPAAQLAPFLTGDLCLASANAPELCVASGPNAQLEDLARRLAERGIESQRVKIDIAAHSAMLEPILAEFGAYLRGIRLSPPEIPIASNLTGAWLTREEATDPEYWVRHLRNTVRYADCVARLLEQPGRVLLEVGPGRTLSSLARQNEKLAPGQTLLASLRHPDEPVSDGAFLTGVLGKLWGTGLAIDWERIHKGEKRQRLALPTYAFQGQKYWIAPGEVLRKPAAEETSLQKLTKLEDWFYRPVWRSRALEPAPEGTHRWLVFVDPAGVGARVAEQLRAAGDTVLCVREGDAFYRVSEHEFALAPEEGRAGYDALLAELGAANQLPDRMLHLWTLTADERARPGSSFFHHVQERGFYSLLFFAQAWSDAGISRPLHLCVVSNDSQQVADEPLRHPVKATVLGPCRVIPQEFPGVTCTSVDAQLPDVRRRFGRAAAQRELDQLVEQLAAEARSPAQTAVVAWRGGERFVRDFESHAPAPLADKRTRLRDGGTYLITGGLGGIGLVLAEHLAKTRKARLVLVGRERLPERDEWETWLAAPTTPERTRRKLRKLLELEAAGAEVFAASADVADLKQMDAVISAARERFGAIHGAIHAAGILDDDLIALKTQAAIDEVLTPKIQGTLVLDELLAGADLDFLLLFSSTSSLLGAAGQVDYVAANAFLNAFAQSRRGRSTYTVAVNWGVWASVGMAAQAAESGAHRDSPEKRSLQSAEHPLLDFLAARGPDEIRFESVWSTRDQWVLDEHRTRAGQALLPGTGYLELARAALAEGVEPGPMQLDNLAFIAPLTVDDGAPRAVRTSLRKDRGGFALRVESRPADTHGEWQLHAQGQIARAELPAAESLDLAAIRARCTRSLPPDPGGIRTRQEDHLAFGPRWRCLREAHFGAHEALGLLELPRAYRSELSDWQLHPALLDIATGYAMELIEGYGEGASLYVPLSYKSVRIRGPLPARLWSHVRGAPDNHRDKEVAHFDVTLADDAGRVVLEVERFTIRRIDASKGFAAATHSSPSAHASEPGAHLSPAERAFRRTLAAGILPEEGVAVLERVLAAQPEPQVIATSIELGALVAQVREAVPAAPTSGAKFSRPSLATEYKAPSDELESALVEMFAELLGVEQVGVQDDFFELGGHSLIAVRLFAQVKKRFEVDYPISVLFEAPTVEKLAALLRSELGGDATGAAIERPAFRFLVPMHAGDVGAASAPFFLVAGMFGNVLNLRHLASLVGRERRFYAIQAQGLRGDEEPHRTFEDMAAAYLAELRTVQPHGPYFLGGFSGGGITAFEMAQQLRAAGEEVALLVFLDTPTPQPPDRLTARDKIVIHAQRLWREGPRYFTNWARARIAWELAKRRPQPDASSAPYEFRSKVIEAAFYGALRVYETRPFAGRAVLFRPALDLAHPLGGGRVVSSQREFVYADNAWSQYIRGGVEVHEVPGDHDGMVLEPNVRVLAAKLRVSLEEAEARARGGAS